MFFLVSCDRVSEYWSSQNIPPLIQARQFQDRGDNESALKMVNRDISNRGENLENLRLRLLIHLKLGMAPKIENDVYLTFAAATRDYYNTNEGTSLFTSAFCMGILGDQDYAGVLLRLLNQRHPQFNLSTEESIVKTTQQWYEIGLKKYPAR